MTDIELASLPLGTHFEFTLYHGEKVIGYPEPTEGEYWYISNILNGHKKQVLPSQIVSYSGKPSNDLSSTRITSGISYTGDPKFKTLVIIGAGASYNYSFDEQATKLPLAKDLLSDNYSNLTSLCPGVENLAAQILQSNDIEGYFQRQWDRVLKSYNPLLLSNLIDVQFYLHLLFKDLSSNIEFRKNNYSSFFQALRDYLIDKGTNEKSLIVSFNYDTILEQSLSRSFGYSYNKLEDYINMERRFMVLKPHGSWNWIKHFSTDFTNKFNLTSEIHPLFLNKFIFEKKISLGEIMSGLESEPTIYNDSSPQHYYPHLLIPYKTKDLFVMPQEHTYSFAHFLGQVEKIIIIGWKGTEEKFKEILKLRLGNKPISVLYVTAKDDTVEKELKSILPMATFSEVSPYKESKATFTELNNFIQEYPTKVFE